MSTMQHAWLGHYEVSSTVCTGLTFARHSHDECVIGVNLVGEEKVWLDRREFDAGPGSITLYNPGQIQGGGAADGAPWQFVSLYVTADQLAADLGLAHLEFDRSLCVQPLLAQRLAAAVKGALCTDALVRDLNEDAMVVLLGEVVAMSGVRLPGSTATGKAMVLRAQELLAEHLHHSLPLDHLGDELGLSKFHLLRAFQKETGLSPRQWAMQLRTRRAKGLLRNGAAASDVAQDLGFADQSHLNRHFRAAYGMTPGRYQSAVKR
ncbi:AraC family transcriptional regulator [Pseudomonas fluorescens]|uniref:AraC family transcriptional regulator n=1 Tax=Pseudomonas TaxID=286 RepID=UPI00131B00FB|nr:MULTISPECIES: AraC family transcriptional regulator [Pseudomonas]KAE9653484.1 AraC family transcriptional regulator [Pseudomonas sp. PB105]MBD8194439.1 AraC family transcriptional regulator [Pseudomonas fluorescens]MBD8229126.1 AraC family transcriptional regulator [Pseudomonas fluorescens]MBD8787249.1 AraC family transcriptional regulator [Pseudomonas fluorescens]MBD8819601.1 AraC family transcriptional regulator [Pseudomonas fluorescens]